MGHELIKILEEKYPQYKNRFKTADIYFHAYALSAQMIAQNNYIINIRLDAENGLYGEYLSTAGGWEPMTRAQLDEAVEHLFGGPEVLEWLE